jgi:hypothetical protein
VSPARARCTVRLQMSLGPLVAGIDVGGTNTDATLVFTTAPRTADNAEVVELLESWADGDIGELLCAGIKACAPPCLGVQRHRTLSRINKPHGPHPIRRLTVCGEDCFEKKPRSKTVYCGPS